jgi:hypothetical protein
MPMRPTPTDSTETQPEAADPAATTDAAASPDGANGNGNGAAAPSGRPTVVDTPQVDPLAAAGGSAGQRGTLRRRLEKLRRELDKQRSELGTLVVDAKKRSPTARPKAVDVRAEAVAELEAQVAALAHAVEGDRVRRELRAGIAGTCNDCGRLIATEDRFCPKCGLPTKAGRLRPGEAEAAKAAAAGGAQAAEAASPGEGANPAPEAASAGDATAGASDVPAKPDSATTAEFTAVSGGDTSENPAISRAALEDAPPPTAGTEQRPTESH